jgi:hypothetical protein
MVLPAHALQAELLMLKSVSNEGDFTLEVERVFVRISSKNAGGSPKNATW